MKRIRWARLLCYQGRNGPGKMIGMEIWPGGTAVTLYPVNSKDDIANCQMQIPMENIPEVIAELQKHYNDAKPYVDVKKGV